MTRTDIRLLAECDDNAFWIADDAHGNIAIQGARPYLIPAGSLTPQPADFPDSFIGQFIDGHVLSTVPGDSCPILLLPQDKRVRLPENASADQLYSSAYDPSVEKLYLLTVNSMVQVSFRTLEVQVTPFQHPPDASYAYYERIVARDGCAVAYRDGLAFWSHRSHFRRDERYYSIATIVGPDEVIAAEEQGPIHLYNAAGDLTGELAGPRGKIWFLDTFEGEPFVVWFEGSSRMRHQITERTVPLGDTDVPLFNVWVEDRCSYAKMLRSEADEPVYLGEFSVHPCVVIAEARCMVFGTMEGVIVLWDLSTNSVETVELPGIEERRNPRVQSLIWCKARQQLFIGTRDGGVYVGKLLPSGS